MKPEQQRIKLAEWDGWKDIQKCTCSGSEWIGTKNGDTTHLPDYLNDLNAVAKLEEKLTSEQAYDYSLRLDTYRSDRCFAPASDRCDALCKTLGLWKSE